jgi:hypothetical protein
MNQYGRLNTDTHAHFYESNLSNNAQGFALHTASGTHVHVALSNLIAIPQLMFWQSVRVTQVQVL